MRSVFVVIATTRCFLAKARSGSKAISKNRLLRPFQSSAIMLMILLFSTLCYAQVKGEEADFAFARKAFSDGFYSLAQENLEDFLNRYPETGHLYEARLLLGRCFYYQNNFKKASYEFDIVLNAGPAITSQDAALYWTGDIYYRVGDLKKALEYYQKGIDEYPASKYSPYALYSKAWVYYRLGFLEGASSIFGDVVSRSPLEKIAVDSLFKIGQIYYLSGDFEDARKALNNFIERYPVSEKAAESYYLLGDISLKEAGYGDSIMFFKRALFISPNAVWVNMALFRMAQAYLNINDFDESIKIFEVCLRQDANPLVAGNALLGLVYNYEKKGMIEDALKACDDLSIKFPRTDAASEGYYMKARILYDNNRLEEAEEACLKGMDKFLSPTQTGKIHYMLGWVYIKEKKTKEALVEFRAAIKGLKDDIFNSSALCKIGDIYFERGEFDEAAKNFDDSLKTYPDSPYSDYAQYRIGDIFFYAKKYDLAIMAYQSLLVNFPNTGLRKKAIFNLAVAYFERGSFAESLSEFKKLAGLSSGYREDPACMFYIANSLYNLYRYEEALEIFKALVKDPAAADFAPMSQYQAGWCYYRMDRDMEAVDSFDIFMKKYPNSVFKKDVLDKSTSILLKAAKNFEKWKMPNDAARLYKRLEEMRAR